MVSKGDKVVVLYPRYFDARLSRAEGRRVPKKFAVRNPDASWVASAAKKAGFDPDKQDSAAHPAVPYDPSGRVLVEPQGSKEKTIRAVAVEMKASEEAPEPAGGKRRKRGRK